MGVWANIHGFGCVCVLRSGPRGRGGRLAAGETPCISGLGSSARVNLSGPMHIGCKINREKRFPGCVLDSIKIRILQLYPCNPAPQHRRGDCLARRLTSWPRTTRPLRPSAKLSSGPHSDAPSPASRTTRERPSFFSATAIADAMSRRFALAAAARSWRARPAPRHVHLHSLYASPRSQLTHATPRLAPCSTGQGHCHCRPSPPLARSAAGVMRRARSALSVGIRG